MFGWFCLEDPGQPTTSHEASSSQKNTVVGNLDHPEPRNASSRLPAIDQSIRNGNVLNGAQGRQLLPSLGISFVGDPSSMLGQATQLVLPRSASTFVSEGFDQSRTAAAPLSSNRHHQLHSLYPLHNPSWSSSNTSGGMGLGAPVLPALTLALHGQNVNPPSELERAPAQSDPLSCGGEELSDDSAEGRVSEPYAVRRSRGRPRGAKDKQPRVKRAPAIATAAESVGNGGTAPAASAEDIAEADLNGRGRVMAQPTAPVVLERRPASAPRRSRAFETAGAGRPDGGEGGTGEGCGRRKPWKIVLCAQDALDIYRQASPLFSCSASLSFC